MERNEGRMGGEKGVRRLPKGKFTVKIREKTRSEDKEVENMLKNRHILRERTLKWTNVMDMTKSYGQERLLIGQF